MRAPVQKLIRRPSRSGPSIILALLLLTDVPAVETGFGTPDARPIGHTTPGELRRKPFPAGSMGPKVEAACRFVERTGGMAAIGALDDAPALLVGQVGTVITTSGARLGA